MHDHDVGGEIGVAGRLEKPRLLERMDIKKPEAAIAEIRTGTDSG